MKTLVYDPCHQNAAVRREVAKVVSDLVQQVVDEQEALEEEIGDGTSEALEGDATSSTPVKQVIDTTLSETERIFDHHEVEDLDQHSSMGQNVEEAVAEKDCEEGSKKKQTAETCEEPSGEGNPIQMPLETVLSQMLLRISNEIPLVIDAEAGIADDKSASAV